MSVGYPDSVPSRPLTSRDRFGEIHAPHMPLYSEAPRRNRGSQLWSSREYTTWNGIVDCLPIYALFFIPVAAVGLVAWLS